jgi:hypothetical protein
MGDNGRVYLRDVEWVLYMDAEWPYTGVGLVGRQSDKFTGHLIWARVANSTRSHN